MHSYQIDLLQKSGLRDCLMWIVCAKDRSAITFAETVFRMNRKRVARVTVWRDDEIIFEAPPVLRLN